MTKYECTRFTQDLRQHNTDEEVAKMLAISKPTMYTRLKKNNWKVTELSHIEKLKICNSNKQ